MKQNKFIKKSEIEKYNIDSTSEENIIFRDSSNFEEISSPNGNVFNVLGYCRGEKSTLSMFRYDSNDTTTLLKRYDYSFKLDSGETECRIIGPFKVGGEHYYNDIPSSFKPFSPESTKKKIENLKIRITNKWDCL